MAGMYDIKKPAAIEEDDPLWQYYQQLRAQEMSASPVDDRQYKSDMNKTYREQNLMNELIPTLAKAGANMGTVGGRTARTVLDYQTPDPREADRRFSKSDERDDLKRQLLYSNLMSGLSTKIAGKDKFQQEKDRQAQMQELARIKLQQDADARAAKLAADAERSKSDRDFRANESEAQRNFRLQQAEADRAARLQQAEADRKLREELGKQGLSLKGKQLENNQKVQEAKLAKGDKPNQDQGSYAIFGQQMLDSEKELDAVIAKKYKPEERMAAVRKLPGIYTFLATQDDRAYEAAKRKFIGAYLRKTSGAAISDSEYKREEDKFYPQAGDGPEVMAQKKAARQAAAKNFIQLGASAAPKMVPATQLGVKAKADPAKARMILEKMMKNPELLNSKNPRDVSARQYIIDAGLEADLRKAQGGR